MIYRLRSLLLPKQSPLRTGRGHRRAQSQLDRRRPRYSTPIRNISERLFAPEERTEPAHWEGDLIVGRLNKSAIGTLVERNARYVKLIHMMRHDAASLRDGLIAAVGDLPARLRRTVTWDQGLEMSVHFEITAKLGTDVFFCDAGSPWQRSSNENTNGLLRQYFPKRTDLRALNPADLAMVEHQPNRRPRAVLRDRTPAEVFVSLLPSETPSMLR